MIRQYRTLSEANNNFIFVDGVKDVKYNEFVEFVLINGEKRFGRVVEVCHDRAKVEIIGDISGLKISSAKVHFLGKYLTIGVSDEMTGRVFDGFCQPLDDAPNIIAQKYIEVPSLPINPLVKTKCDENIKTGISAVDGFCPIKKGEAHAIFSSFGLAHNNLITQIAAGAVHFCNDPSLTIIVLALGQSPYEIECLVKELKEYGIFNRTIVLVSYLSDPKLKHVYTTQSAFALAQFLAFECSKDVLLLASDFTKCSQEFSELASLFSKVGKLKGKEGSITSVVALTVPNCGILHPIAQNMQRLCKNTLSLSIELKNRGIYPPVEPSIAYNERLKECLDNYKNGTKLRYINKALLNSNMSVEELKLIEFAKRFENDFILQGTNEFRTASENETILNGLIEFLKD